MTELSKALYAVANHMQEQLPTGTITGHAITESAADWAVIKAFRRLAATLEGCSPEADEAS